MAQPMAYGARGGAMGGAVTALRGDPWAENAAAPATLTGRAADFFASEAFGIDEMRLGALVAVQPLRWATLAAEARTFGFEHYRESAFSVGVARPFRFGTQRHVHLGIALHTYHLALGDYGAATTWGLSAGWGGLDTAADHG